MRGQVNLEISILLYSVEILVISFLEKTSASVGSQTPFCERSNKVDEFVACNSYFITSYCHFSMILMHILLVVKCAYQVLD